MPRPANPDPCVHWKNSLPATLAGRVEAMLLDPIHAKPIYGARSFLLEKLLEYWIARESGATDTLPPIPTLMELRDRSNAGTQ